MAVKQYEWWVGIMGAATVKAHYTNPEQVKASPRQNQVEEEGNASVKRERQNK